MPIELSDDEYVALIDRSNDPNRPLPSPGATLVEKAISQMIDPDIPVKEGSKLSKTWFFSGKNARHVELTNFPTPEIKKQFNRTCIGLLRISHWDVDPTYMDDRQALVSYRDILANKSLGYTTRSRERDALNESRQTNTLRDERPLPPRESGGGFLGFLKRG